MHSPDILLIYPELPHYWYAKKLVYGVPVTEVHTASFVGT